MSRKMEHTTIYTSSHDGQKIFLRIWDQVEKPKGIVQIIHGMAEHSARYETFACFLNKKGYIVYADDHRECHNRKLVCLSWIKVYLYKLES